MDSKLTWSQRMTISFMLFGMLFGAGNLIFPVYMGQQSGNNVFLTTLGFILAGVGLPFLGVVAMGVTNSKDVHVISKLVGQRFADWFTVALYLIIGPLFAIPRLASTTFEIGLAPFVSTEWQTGALALFSCLFFIVAWYFSRRPSNILDTIGRILTPLFLILLAIILVQTLWHPMGAIETTGAQLDYQNHPVFQGFIDGYNTLDAIAAMAFGAIIIQNFNYLGVKSPKGIAIESIKSGVVGMAIMALIYGLLALAGATSQNQFDFGLNGGVILRQITVFYLGKFGNMMLALLVLVACLKTGIGLITSFAQTFAHRYPVLSYGKWVALTAILSAIMATIGLTEMLALFNPILRFVYPIAIVLILLALASPLFQRNRVVFQWAIGLTIVAAALDALQELPTGITQWGPAHTLITLAQRVLPLYAAGFGWVLPAIIGMIIGWWCSNNKKS